VLISGNPLTLRHPLYTAFFTDRIEVPVTTSARLQPRTDDADDYDNAYDTLAGVSAHLTQSAGPVRHASVQQLEQRMAREVAAMRPPAAMAAPPPRLGAAANAAETGEASTQLLYCFPGRMSLTTGHTMMVPFVDHEVPAVRTWLYQPETSAAIRLPLCACATTAIAACRRASSPLAGDGSVNPQSTPPSSRATLETWNLTMDQPSKEAARLRAVT
jgi:hypothetical protein